MRPHFLRSCNSLALQRLERVVSRASQAIACAMLLSGSACTYYAAAHGPIADGSRVRVQYPAPRTVATTNAGHAAADSMLEIRELSGHAVLDRGDTVHVRLSSAIGQAGPIRLRSGATAIVTTEGGRRVDLAHFSAGRTAGLAVGTVALIGLVMAAIVAHGLSQLGAS